MQGLGEFWSPSPGIWSWQEPSGNRNIRQSWLETGWGLSPVGNVRGPEIKGWMQKELSADGASRGQQGVFQRNPLKFKKCICWQRKWTQHEQLCMTSHNISDYESFLSAFHFLLFFLFITFIFCSLVLLLFHWKILHRLIWISSKSLYGLFPFHSIFTLWLVPRFVSDSYNGMGQLGKIQTEAQNSMLLIKMNAMGPSTAVATVYEVSSGREGIGV